MNEKIINLKNGWMAIPAEGFIVMPDAFERPEDSTNAFVVDVRGWDGPCFVFFANKATDFTDELVYLACIKHYPAFIRVLMDQVPPTDTTPDSDPYYWVKVCLHYIHPYAGIFRIPDDSLGDISESATAYGIVIHRIKRS